MSNLKVFEKSVWGYEKMPVCDFREGIRPGGILL